MIPSRGTIVKTQATPSPTQMKALLSLPFGLVPTSMFVRFLPIAFILSPKTNYTPGIREELLQISGKSARNACKFPRVSNENLWIFPNVTRTLDKKWISTISKPPFIKERYCRSLYVFVERERRNEVLSVLRILI